MSLIELNDEIKKVLEYSGRDTSRGDIKDEHCIKLLSYLIKNKRGDYKKMLGIMAYQLSMDNRKIRENYLEGIEYMGLMEVISENNTRYWIWKGIPNDDEKKVNPEMLPYLEAKKRLQENENKA